MHCLRAARNVRANSQTCPRITTRLAVMTRPRPVIHFPNKVEHLVRGDMEDVDAEVAGGPSCQDDDAAQVVVGDAPVLPHSAGLRIRADEAERKLGIPDHPAR